MKHLTTVHGERPFEGDSLEILFDERDGRVHFIVEDDMNGNIASVVLSAETSAALAIAISTATFPFLPTSRAI